MKILLADDHNMVRAGLSLLLARLYGDIELFEASTYPQALELCHSQKDFSLALVDRVMPGHADGESLRTLCQLLQPSPVVVLSATEDPHSIRESLALGAQGYLPKSTHESLLFSALQLVMAGGTFIPTSALESAHTQESAPAAPSPKQRKEPELQTLTPRQQDILNRLALGETNKVIARELAISPATVQTHINAIFRALSANNRTQAVHLARSLGLIRYQENN